MSIPNDTKQGAPNDSTHFTPPKQSEINFAIPCLWGPVGFTDLKPIGDGAYRQSWMFANGHVLLTPPPENKFRDILFTWALEFYRIGTNWVGHETTICTKLPTISPVLVKVRGDSPGYFVWGNCRSRRSPLSIPLLAIRHFEIPSTNH